MAMYEVIRDWIYGEIAAGHYKVGDQLPTLDQLNERFRMRGPSTASRAYSELADLGLVERRHGVGFFLASLTPTRTDPSGAVVARLDAMEAALETVLADLRTIRAGFVSTAPKAGEWWNVRSKTDHQQYQAVLMKPDDADEPIWFVAIDNTTVRRKFDYFEAIRRLDEIPNWSSSA